MWCGGAMGCRSRGVPEGCACPGAGDTEHGGHGSTGAMGTHPRPGAGPRGRLPGVTALPLAPPRAASWSIAVPDASGPCRIHGLWVRTGAVGGQSWGTREEDAGGYGTIPDSGRAGRMRGYGILDLGSAGATMASWEEAERMGPSQARVMRGEPPQAHGEHPYVPSAELHFHPQGPWHPLPGSSCSPGTWLLTAQVSGD